MNSNVLVSLFVAAVASVTLAGAAVMAQAPAPPTPPTPRVTTVEPVQTTQAAAPRAADASIPLKVVVTFARYDDAKKLSSAPFTLWVNANDSALTELNVGVMIPVPQAIDGSNGPFSYQRVGTTINSSATQLSDGRYRVRLDIADTSVVSAPTGTGGSRGAPTLQSISIDNYVLVRDGQSTEFLAATDKTTGQVTRIEVMVTAVK